MRPGHKKRVYIDVGERFNEGKLWVWNRNRSSSCSGHVNLGIYVPGTDLRSNSNLLAILLRACVSWTTIHLTCQCSGHTYRLGRWQQAHWYCSLDTALSVLVEIGKTSYRVSSIYT